MFWRKPIPDSNQATEMLGRCQGFEIWFTYHLTQQITQAKRIKKNQLVVKKVSNITHGNPERLFLTPIRPVREKLPKSTWTFEQTNTRFWAFLCFWLGGWSTKDKWAHVFLEWFSPEADPDLNPILTTLLYTGGSEAEPVAVMIST